MVLKNTVCIKSKKWNTRRYIMCLGYKKHLRKKNYSQSISIYYFDLEGVRKIWSYTSRRSVRKFPFISRKNSRNERLLRTGILVLADFSKQHFKKQFHQIRCHCLYFSKGISKEVLRFGVLFRLLRKHRFDGRPGPFPHFFPDFAKKGRFTDWGEGDFSPFLKYPAFKLGSIPYTYYHPSLRHPLRHPLS